VYHACNRSNIIRPYLHTACPHTVGFAVIDKLKDKAWWGGDIGNIIAAASRACECNENHKQKKYCTSHHEKLLIVFT
jgi:hypothetical protein